MSEEYVKRLLRLHECCAVHEYMVYSDIMYAGILAKSFYERMMRHRARKEKVKDLIIKLIKGNA